jgi:VWFA-related protein
MRQLRTAGLLSLPILLLLFARQGASQQQQDSVVIRTTTRLVTLDVVVLDKSGKPVPGLQAQDFVLLDNGKPQPNIRIFRHGIAEDAAARTMQGPAPALPDAAQRMRLPDPLPAGLFTNLRQAESMPPTATIVLFDVLNTSVEDQVFAKAQISKFLQNLPAGEPVGLYALTSQLRVVHPLSTDAASLAAQLDRKPVYAGANVETESTVLKTLDNSKLNQILFDPRVKEMVEFQISADQNAAITKLADRMDRTFGALESIAHHLAPVSGRKSLLWVSAAFPMVVSSDIRTGTGSPVSFGHAADRAFRALTGAGVSVYPIDARGVMVDPLYRAKDAYSKYAMGQLLGASRSRGGRRGGRATFTSPDPLVYAERDETTAHHDIMQDIAKRTGGRAFFDTNAVSKAALDAMSDNAGSYTLGFYPPEADDSGKFHRVQVKINDRPGVTVRHREGYFTAVSKPGKDVLRRDSMFTLMSGPLTSGTIPLAVQCMPVDGSKLRVVMRMDPTAVTLREASARWYGELEILLLYTDDAGNRKGAIAETLKLDLSGEEYAHAMDQGINYRLDAPFAAGSKFLTVGVRDNTDGRVGTIRVDLGEVLAR